MPFHTEPIEEVRLNSLQAVTDWIQSSQDHLRRIPLKGVLEHGATFHDDEYLGGGDTLFHFNRHGFQAFCHWLGFRVDQLARLETPSLASLVLNDLLSQRAVRGALTDDELVVDERTGIVIGLVSKTYVTYSNVDFLVDIKRLLTEIPKDQQLDFHEAFAVNTELTLRFTSVKHHGCIRGRGGEGPDKSALGLDFKNTMVGSSAIRINYFLHRLICANGLMVPAAEAINRVFHSGQKNTLRERLDRSFAEVRRNLSRLPKLLDTLGSMDFEPETLSRTRRITDAIFEVIPGSRQMISEQEKLFLRYREDSSAAEREQMRREHDARMIESIPKHFGGEFSKRVFASAMRDKASLFDFINVFTEHAKSKAPAQRLEIEERAGVLAQYIASNARRL